MAETCRCEGLEGRWGIERHAIASPKDASMHLLSFAIHERGAVEGVESRDRTCRIRGAVISLRSSDATRHVSELARTKLERR